MYKKINISRGPDIDLEKCVAAMDNNRYRLVIHASLRAKEIKHTTKAEGKRVYINGPVEALLEIQDGRIDPVYLSKY